MWQIIQEHVTYVNMARIRMPAATNVFNVHPRHGHIIMEHTLPKIVKDVPPGRYSVFRVHLVILAILESIVHILTQFSIVHYVRKIQLVCTNL